MSEARQRLTGRLFGLSLIGFAIAAIFWDDRAALLALVPGCFFLAISLSAAINVEEGMAAADALFPFLLALAPAFALFGLTAHLLGGDIAKLGLWIAAAVTGGLAVLTFAWSSTHARPSSRQR